MLENVLEAFSNLGDSESTLNNIVGIWVW